MKKSLSILAVCAFVVAFAVAANAQTSGSTEPAKPAEPAKAAAPATTTAPKAHSSSSSKSHETKPVLDLNSASKEDLMKLPGVGDATADKIIAGRPWKSRSELVSKNVCTKANYEKFQHMVTAKQPAPAAAAK